MIREYVAIVVMGRKRHMKICGTILGFALFVSILSFIFFNSIPSFERMGFLILISKIF